MQDLTIFIANHMALTYAFAIVLILLMVVEFLRAKRNNVRIDTTRAVQLINHETAVVFDIRSQENFRKGHIIDAQLISAREIEQNPKRMEKYRAKPIIITCNAGLESQKIAALLLKQGYNAYALSGGIRAWNDAQLPLIKG